MLQNCPLTGAGRKDDENIPEILAMVTKHCECSFFPLKFFFFFKFYNIVLVLPYIKMNLPQVYMCSPSWNHLPPPSPYHPSGSCQCTSPKHPVSCIKPGLATRFIYDITRFNAIIPNHPTLSGSHRVQKIVLYISVSFAVSSQWILGVGDGQGGLACCCSWGRKE